MKVYIVMEYAVIEYEECYDIMGVFSSAAKAKEAIAEYKEHTKNCCGHHEYSWYEYEVDQIWEQ